MFTKLKLIYSEVLISNLRHTARLGHNSFPPLPQEEQEEPSLLTIVLRNYSLENLFFKTKRQYLAFIEFSLLLGDLLWIF